MNKESESESILFKSLKKSARCGTERQNYEKMGATSVPGQEDVTIFGQSASATCGNLIYPQSLFKVRIPCYQVSCVLITSVCLKCLSN